MSARATSVIEDALRRSAPGKLDELARVVVRDLEAAGVRLVELDPDRTLEEQRADRVRAWLTTDDPWNSVEELVQELDDLASVRSDARLIELQEAIEFLREGLGGLAERDLPISVAAYALGLVRAFASVYAPPSVQRRAARQASTFAGRATRQSGGSAPATAREEAARPSGSGLAGPSPEQAGDVTRAQPMTDDELEEHDRDELAASRRDATEVGR